MKTPATTEWLKAPVSGSLVGVDRDKKILRGFVVAQRGPFKTPGRGEFDDSSLATIAQMINSQKIGLKSRFTHPDLSNDGLGKYLGRAREAFIDNDRVRANLYLDPSSFNTPHGNLGGYVLDLAESDSEAISSSLVLTVDKEYRLEADGTAKKDENGDPLPPLWRPKKLHATDIVDTGDAVDGLLSTELDADGLPDALVRRGSELLDKAFPGLPREVTEKRLTEYLQTYLNRRYGDPETRKRNTDLLRKRMKLRQQLREAASRC